MADYRAWQGVGEALGAGGDAYKQAKAAAQAKKMQDMKLQEETPSVPAASIFAGAPAALNLTRAEAARGWEKRQEIEAAKKAAAALKGGAGAGMQMTPGRKAADMAFGKEYIDYNTMGRPTAEKGLNTLEEARQELKDKGQGLTGPIRGAVPDFIRAFTNPEAVAVKERIRGAVQNTLKSTLGAQFTEKEGERIFNNAYNDRLSPEENINRLDKIIGELHGGMQAKENMGDYFENKGTLTGYQGGASTPAHKSLSAQILADPEASPEDIAWAKQHVGK